jgi:hypothetical protein
MKSSYNLVELAVAFPPMRFLLNPSTAQKPESSRRRMRRPPAIDQPFEETCK